MLRRPDALRRFLLEGVQHPDILPELHGVGDAVRIAALRKCDLEPAQPSPCRGFAISAFPPSAAIVRQIVFAPSGNFSESCSAAFSHEAARHLRASADRYAAPSIPVMLSYLTTLRQTHRLLPFDCVQPFCIPWSLPGIRADRRLQLGRPTKGRPAWRRSLALAASRPVRPSSAAAQNSYARKGVKAARPRDQAGPFTKWRRTRKRALQPRKNHRRNSRH